MKRSIVIIILSVFLALAGCADSNNDGWQPQTPGNEDNNGGDNNNNGDGSGDSNDDNSETPPVTDIVDPDSEDDFVEGFEITTTVRIIFAGTDATIENSAEEVSITKSGAGVTAVSTIKGVEYIVSGTTSDGFLKIYSDYKFKLSLDAANITNLSGPAINIQSGKRCFVVMSGASALADGASYAAAPNGEDQKATLFSEGELIFSGTGSLDITGRNKHAIASDDYVRIREGSVTVKSAASDGIHANDAFIMDAGTLSVASTSDGIECEEGYIYIKGGTITVNAGDDGIVTSFEGTGTSVDSNILVSGGSVTVNTTAQKGHALKSTGDISVTGGTNTIKTTGIAAKGINADGNVVIAGGTTSITTSGNSMVESNDTSSASCVKVNRNFGMTGGSLTVKASGSGAKGISTDGSFIMDDGSLSVTTTGSSYTSGSLRSRPKGIKADGYITVNGGSITVSATHEGIESPSQITIGGGTVEVTATDDGINVSNQGSGHITINGGNIYVYSSGNDGIDSNGTITITGGVVVSSGTSSPEEGFDCDNNTFTVSGGIIIGTGGATSYPKAGTQHTIIYSGSGTSGQYTQLRDSSGTALITYKIPRSYSSMTMVLSHPSVARSSSYTFVTGGIYSGGTEVFHGYYTGGTYSGGTSTSYSTGSSTYYTSNGSSGGGPGGGGRP